MQDEHLFVVTYDISDARRWRSVFRLMKGYGDWLQLSVFQCRLTRQRHVELLAALAECIHADEDHVMVMDIGVADAVAPKVRSLGKRKFEPIERVPIIV